MALIVVYPGNAVVGGMASVVSDFNKEFIKLETDLYYVCTHDKKARWSFFSLAKSLCFFVYLCIFKSIDAIHIHTASNGSFYRKSIFCVLGNAFHIRVVMHMHGGAFAIFYDNSNYIIKKFVQYIICKKVTCLVVLSESWFNWFTDNFKFINDPVVVRNSVEQVISDPIEINKSSDFKIVFVGRVVESKGVFDLLQAYSNLPFLSNTNLTIVGPYDQLIMNSKLNSYGLTGKVRLLGALKREDTLQEIVNSDVLVLPSYNEGLPITVIEAMACCTAVIATNVGGIPDMIQHRVNGLLFNPGDVSVLTDLLDLLMSNDLLKNKLACQGYETWKDKYTFEKNFPVIINVLNGAK